MTFSPLAARTRSSGDSRFNNFLPHCILQTVAWYLIEGRSRNKRKKRESFRLFRSFRRLIFCLFRISNLEVKLQAELDNPRVACGQDLPEAARITCNIRWAEIGAIESVEELCPELKAAPL